jgi:IS5 family transposase
VIKQEAVPLEFGKNKLEQKDTEARWTKKNNEKRFGYKDHVKANSKSKLIEDYVVTDASVHDSQVVDELTAHEIENQIHEKGYRNKPLTEEQIMRLRATQGDNCRDKACWQEWRKKRGSRWFKL